MKEGKRERGTEGKSEGARGRGGERGMEGWRDGVTG